MKKYRIRKGSIADKALTYKAKFDRDYIEELAVGLLVGALIVAAMTIDVYDPYMYAPH